MQWDWKAETYDENDKSHVSSECQMLSEWGHLVAVYIGSHWCLKAARPEESASFSLNSATTQSSII